VMFVTISELATMYQLWSLLSEKCHLESSAVERNGLQNSNFSGTSSFMKIRSFGLSPSFSRSKTSPSSSYESILDAVGYDFACCAGADIADIFCFFITQRTCLLGLNEYLACSGLVPSGLCCKEMMVVDLVLVVDWS
jgi:hypothetical protein